MEDQLRSPQDTAAPSLNADDGTAPACDPNAAPADPPATVAAPDAPADAPASCGEETAAQEDAAQAEPAAEPADAPARDEPAQPAPEPPKKPAKKPAQPIDRAVLDRQYVDKAADRSEYLTYDSDRLEIAPDDAVTVFAASRIGLGHLDKNKPCQDACLYRAIAHGAALLNADGISACKHSEVGSRLACEIAADKIAALSKGGAPEDEFIRTLCSDEFYASIREEWVSRIKAEWLAQGGSEKDNALVHYGTTLLIAVITENWYVAMNLGDGQILLFSEEECLKVRLAEKAGSAPSALVYDNYLENVQRGVFSRKYFSGILLMTDGMNDRLEMLPWYACHAYAKQAAERFLKHGEPMQPFIYSGNVAGEQRTYDVSRQRSASDDFSVVMALSAKPLCARAGMNLDQIRARIPDQTAIQLLRRIGEKASYLVAAPDCYRIVYAVPDDESIAARDPRLTHFKGARVRLWDFSDRWTHEGMRYTAYNLTFKHPLRTPEERMQEFRYNAPSQYHKVEGKIDPATQQVLRIVEPLVGEGVLASYRALCALEEHLSCQNLALNDAALSFIMQLDDKHGTMLIPQEALTSCAAPASPVPWVLTTRALSPSLIGSLSCGQLTMPLFSHAGAARSELHYYFDAKPGSEGTSRFFRIVRNPAKKLYGLLNVGSLNWLVTAEDGKQVEIKPKQVVTLVEGRTFSVMDGDKRRFTCTMHLI